MSEWKSTRSVLSRFVKGRANDFFHVQDALNLLCDHLPAKIEVFGEFSHEVIDAEARIGAIYLREGECLSAAEHLKTVGRSFSYFHIYPIR